MSDISTKRDQVGRALIVLIGIFSVLLWQTFSVVIDIKEGTSLFRPLLWLVLLSASFFLGSIVWKQAVTRLIGTILLILPSLFFLVGWEYSIVSIIVFLFFYQSSVNIFLEGKERIRFRFFRSVRSGSTLFFLGIALLFSTGYYLSLKEMVWEELVPRFRISQEMTQGIFRVAGVINPSFAQLTEGDTTVDEFLLNLEQNRRTAESVSSSEEVSLREGLSITPGMRQLLAQKMSELPVEMSSAIEQQLFLEGGRVQIASFVGRPVGGSEKIADILSLIIQNKLTALLQGESTTGHVPTQAIPFFVTLLLFLTLISLSSILNPLCILFSQFLFWLMLKSGLLTLETITVEQQKLRE